MINITRFLNVSMIVRDLDDSLRVYEDLFGLRCAYRVAVPQMASDSAIVPVGGGISYSVELVRPMTSDETSPRPDSTSSYTGTQASGILDRFLERRGEGVYRLAFEVEDFDAAVGHLRDLGIRTTYYALDLPTGKNEVVITNPKDTCGVMFEFLPLGSYEPGAKHETWPVGETGTFKRFLNTSCVVRDLDQARETLKKAFGLEPNRVETVPEMAVTAAIFTIGEDDTLEMFAPMADDQKKHPRYNSDAEEALQRYLARRGEGVYRLAFEVKDYDASIKRLEEHGVSYVPFDLELATGPLRVAIVDPRATKGVMFELCEPDNPAYRPAS